MATAPVTPKKRAKRRSCFKSSCHADVSGVVQAGHIAVDTNQEGEAWAPNVVELVMDISSWIGATEGCCFLPGNNIPHHQQPGPARSASA